MIRIAFAPVSVVSNRSANGSSSGAINGVMGGCIEAAVVVAGAVDGTVKGCRYTATVPEAESARRHVKRHLC